MAEVGVGCMWAVVESGTAPLRSWQRELGDNGGGRNYLWASHVPAHCSSVFVNNVAPSSSQTAVPVFCRVTHDDSYTTHIASTDAKEGAFR